MKKQMDFTITELLIVLIFFAIIIFAPLLIIWALNTLFALGIAYTFWTWLAALILGGAIKARVSKD